MGWNKFFIFMFGAFFGALTLIISFLYVLEDTEVYSFTYQLSEERYE